MASWLGFCATEYYHAPATIKLPVKKTNSSRTLADLCKAVTPSCHLNPLLFNGHLQTLSAAVTHGGSPIHYRRHVFVSDSIHYPGQFAVDFVSRTPAPPERPTIMPRTTAMPDDEWEVFEKGSKDSRPLLIVLHGIGGGSHELYLRCVIESLIEGGGGGTSTTTTASTSNPKGTDQDNLWLREDGSKSDGSAASPNSAQSAKADAETWEALVINARGCAKSDITTPRLFNARATWDVRQLVKWLRKIYPNRPLYAVGFSLGANILVNYLGEEGTNCQLKAAVSCSNPWNLEAGSLALQRSWIGSEVYSKALRKSMNALFERHVDQISKDPRIDIAKVRATKYLHDFDREFQGPVWGYPTEGAYYRDASSTESLLAVRIPLFAIHADDDPVAPREAVPVEEAKRNPYVVLCNTSMGGHLGWFEITGGRWFIKPVVNFLRKMVEDVDFDALNAQRRADSDAMLKVVAKVKRPVFNAMRRKLDVPIQ